MRILSALKADMKFQFKQGFYLVYVILTLFYMILISQLPNGFTSYVVPIVVFTDPSFVGFFFIGGIVMLEKVQGVLQYLVVTPLRPREYLISKVISLAFLAEVAGFAIALATYKESFNWILLFFGIFLTSVFFTLYGFIVTNGCTTINQYLIKMVPYMLVLTIPTLLYFFIPSIWILQLLPSIAGFKLVYGAFNGITTIEVMGYICYLILVNSLILLKVEKFFIKNIIKG
ncbi:fluoroquinolone export ABC transporter permease subunit [Alkaliphilus peptidifermentans]|uniref:Fluoroquinolone transport system permease protein n=1 Tax=Alkaliphilus peptidifermentans DSM 18978 TaxID=1120976 RepID=A0A1G5LEI3_9FIRM|nr:ABC transporter permease [Alkaliphilus peptidifermentans]SCZ10708.1 fluoroquinolone transport system permease protein [Alkaliphilus peptidifermentans DSM 18978]